jgi:hypothetical protein
MADTKPTTTVAKAPAAPAPKAPAPAPKAAAPAASKPLKLPNKPAAQQAGAILGADNNSHMMYMTTCLDRVAFF